MNITEKYLNALKSCDDWVLVSEWAEKVGEFHPDLLEKANQEAANQANDTTGLREIAARISSAISRGAYQNKIEIDAAEKPRKVRFLPEESRAEHDQIEIDEDVAPLRRGEIIKKADNSLGSFEKYRVNEFEAISKQFKLFFGLDFEVDHAKALLNGSDQGSHHPDNLQLLLKSHNAKKSNNNWDRFKLDEQIGYINSAVELQHTVASRFGIEMEMNLLESLIERLKKVY